MNKKLKTKWLKALRSGKYQQYRDGGLKHIDGDGNASFCCLGVLCEIGGLRSKSVSYIMGRVHGRKVYRFIEENVQHDLADMNDAGKNFRVIANYVEKKL